MGAGEWLALVVLVGAWVVLLYIAEDLIKGDSPESRVPGPGSRELIMVTWPPPPEDWRGGKEEK